MTATQAPRSHSGASRERGSREVETNSAWNSPVMTYYLIGGAALILLGIGLVMVLSSSMIFSLRDSANSDGELNPFARFSSQLIFAAVAFPMAWVISRFPTQWLRRLAWPALGLGLALQAALLVPGLQRAQGGNSAWLYIGGGMTLQPSEFAKLALAVWLGAALAARGERLTSWRELLWPVGAVVAVYIGLVMYGRDLGTAMIFVALTAGALFVAGIPMSKLASIAVAGAGFVAFFLALSSNRMQRILSFLSGSQAADPTGLDLQPIRAMEALATGGLTGVGLGSSRNKWLYLPEAHNDFIFAIIGEELGLLGALVVLGLFVILAIGVTRLVRRHDDRFVKITAAAIGTWILTQALVNICVVVGLLPVIGVPLPLVSSGGSSLIATMLGIGVLLAFARHEPGAQEYFRARPSMVRRAVTAIGRGR